MSQIYANKLICTIFELQIHLLFIMSVGMFTQLTFSYSCSPTAKCCRAIGLVTSRASSNRENRVATVFFKSSAALAIADGVISQQFQRSALPGYCAPTIRGYVLVVGPPPDL
jgi:hypothetical protein